MVLIDGMPIVSGLGTVYGLNGIPSALIERMEVVKGAASTLYGSEAVGGLINIITKSSDDAPALSADVFGTTWGKSPPTWPRRSSSTTRSEDFSG